ncbi:MAG: hypothetical protein ABI563_07750 [Specibacter sp.]
MTGFTNDCASMQQQFRHTGTFPNNVLSAVRGEQAGLLPLGDHQIQVVVGDPRHYVERDPSCNARMDLVYVPCCGEREDRLMNEGGLWRDRVDADNRLRVQFGNSCAAYVLDAVERIPAPLEYMFEPAFLGTSGTGIRGDQATGRLPAQGG